MKWCRYVDVVWIVAESSWVKNVGWNVLVCVVEVHLLWCTAKVVMFDN